MLVEIYPREGTETQRRTSAPDSGKLKFIPVRGRKRGFSKSLLRLSEVEIYPREGTET